MGEKTEYIKLTLGEIKESQSKQMKGQEDLTRAFHAHAQDSGIRDATLAEQMKSAHFRIDRHEEGHKETRGWFAALWGGVILAVCTSVWNWVSGRKE